MKNLLQKLSFLFLSTLLLLGSVPALAVSPQNAQDNLFGEFDQVKESSGLSGNDPRIVVAKFIKIALSAVGIILVIIILYAGFLYMTAGGNEDQTAKAKTFIKNAVIGLVITMSAYGITNFIINSVLNATQPQFRIF